MQPKTREPEHLFPQRHPWWTAAIMVLTAFIVLLLVWDWNWLKRPIERRVAAQTARSFHIDGNLDVDLGRTLTIRAERVRLGNAPWAREPEMASVRQIEFDLRFWPLLRGDVQIPRIALDVPMLHLQRNGQLPGNWIFGKQEGGDLPEFRNVRIRNGTLSYYEPGQKTDIKVSVESEESRAQPGVAEPRIAVKGGGTWSGNAFTLSGTAESPLELRDSERPYRIDLRAAAGPTRARARGTLLDPLRLRGFDLKLALAGQNLDDLFPLLGVALPPTPPYALDGRFTRTIESPTRSTWKYDGFTGKVGDSDLSGSAHVSAGGKAKPYLKADLRSARMDLDDLGGFIGLAPKGGTGETTNPELVAKAAQQAASGKLLPDDPWNLAKLRAMDADVRLRAKRIETRKLPVDDMDATLALKDGVLVLKPLDFGLAGGTIRSTIRMDARDAAIRSNADIRAAGLVLAKLMPDSVELGQTAVGKVAGHIVFASQGNSIARIAANADGDVEAGMGAGRISKLLMEFAGLDLAGILKIKLTKDEQIPIRCAYGDFAVKDGVMTPRALVFDTSETRLNGSGTIDLRNERLDLTIKPKTKKFSPLSLRSPLHVEGTFKQPDLRPDYTRIGLRAAAIAVLGSAAAPAALVASTDIGQGKDAEYCGNDATK